MVKKLQAFKVSVVSALLVGLVHYRAHHYFNNPALMTSNITMVGLIVVLSVFLISYFGMTWRGK